MMQQPYLCLLERGGEEAGLCLGEGGGQQVGVSRGQGRGQGVCIQGVTLYTVQTIQGVSPGLAWVSATSRSPGSTPAVRAVPSSPGEDWPGGEV